MTRESCAIPGCSIIRLAHHTDARGEFVKVFQAEAARAAGDNPTIAELFWSRSRRGTVRGLHFQIPPHAHHKLVTIISGAALDVVMDLRTGSPAFGLPVTIELDAADPHAVSIPPGCAHGFQSTTDNTTLLYATSTEHAPDTDHGIRWDTIGVTWPVTECFVSDRDAALPSLVDFVSPFRFEELP